jgi:hypothetical protein
VPCIVIEEQVATAPVFASTTWSAPDALKLPPGSAVQMAFSPLSDVMALVRTGAVVVGLLAAGADPAVIPAATVTTARTAALRPRRGDVPSERVYLLGGHHPAVRIRTEINPLP